MRLACLLLSAAALTQAQEAPAFRVDVQLVRILATVKDPAGGLVGSLEKKDFEVRDNGVAQQIAVFERQTDQPLSVAIMIDNSGSTAKDLKYEIDSVSRFLRALLREGNPEDAVGALQLQLADRKAKRIHAQHRGHRSFAARAARGSRHGAL